MPLNYEAIRDDNVRRYGTDIGRIGPMLLADRYADRTHFIFELLQNAEDAMARRTGWKGPRVVVFDLTEQLLRVSHFGQPFNEDDVRGICGIAESTKDLTAIGRFGIGFKSVYAYTDRPEIHSDAESFAIESFVWPRTVQPLWRDPDETVILIPLRPSDENGFGEIAAGLEGLGASTLLFLRQIEEIRWCVEDGRSGFYRRESQDVDKWVRHVTIIDGGTEDSEIRDEWLVCSRSVLASDGRKTGYVELAFSLAETEKSDAKGIQRLERSPLVVFFPTVVETHLGFLLQGPYRTTPSRDNVPIHDEWNKRLVSETEVLLVEAMKWLRDHDLLDATALQSFPIDSAKFGTSNMFAPLYEATKSAFSSVPLLPCIDERFARSTDIRLGRTQEIRELLDAEQLSSLFGVNGELAWLSGEITQDRTPELRRYLIYELNVTEVSPDTILQNIDGSFLAAQSDSWISKFYEFLFRQPALKWRFEGLPLIRLENGSHVSPRLNNEVQAYLPSETSTSFPTVRAAVCSTQGAREFLQFLGLTQPDPVDDVVRNLLPKYGRNTLDLRESDYAKDIARILDAVGTDSASQREKLIRALRDSYFVMVIDSGDGTNSRSKPFPLYLATERLKDLFSGVPGVLMVDDNYECLRGEEVRSLLEACGATRYLQQAQVYPTFTGEQLRELRVAAGCESVTSGGSVNDYTLIGLDKLLAILPSLEFETRAKKARVLWEALGDMQERRGTGVFSGTYSWSYVRPRSALFDAAFVKQLHDVPWVSDRNGELKRPEFVVFESLGWKANPFLLSKIRFKPPIIEMLAKEAGFEPGVLDLLMKLGLTSEAELRAKLGIFNQSVDELREASEPSNVEDAVKGLLGDASPPTPPIRDPLNPEPTGNGGTRTSSGKAIGNPSGAAGIGVLRRTSGDGNGSMRASGAGPRDSGGATDEAGGWSFVSYVAVHPDDGDVDPDSLDQQARMNLEENAIAFILSHEPTLKRTPALNPGFDLFEEDARGQVVRWIEVKAMTGCLRDRPVGLSHTQFACAQDRGGAFWLYVVEHAGGERARLLRIQDPAGRTRTFTFDHGWLSVAESEPHLSSAPVGDVAE